MRSVIGASRLLVFVLSGLFTIAFQSTVLLFTKGRLAYIYPRYYHAFLCRVFGLKTVVEGRIETGPDVVYISNHVSYLDIEVIGGILTGSFVAKKEVERWPLLGLMGKMQRTLYISRRPADAARETQALLSRLEEGIPLIIFPEGTSSDGTKVLPFKSSFFEIFLSRPVKIQPFTLSIIEVDGKPVNDQNLRDQYAWYGDMTLEPHLWTFAKSRGAKIKLKFEEPVLSLSYTNRKQLSETCHERVSEGLDLSRTAA